MPLSFADDLISLYHFHGKDNILVELCGSENLETLWAS
jgi:hypothetical protein